MLIDKITNIRIGGHAPSVYLKDMQHEFGSKLTAILASHDLPPSQDGPLWADRFEDFLEWRQARLSQELAAVTGP